TLVVLWPIIRIELEGGSVLVGKKLKSEEVLHMGRKRLRFLGIHRRLDHLEHPRLVADHKPPALLRSVTKFAGLPCAPFRIEVAGSYDGKQSGRVVELSDDLI